MKQLCLYCRNDNEQAPCQGCFPLSTDRTQLERLDQVSLRKDKDAEIALKAMTNKLQGKR